MMHFTVETYTPVEAACQKCCCEILYLKPGTTTKVSVGYAPWAVPIGVLHCAPQFALEQMNTCDIPVIGNIPPTSSVGNIIFNTPMNTPFSELLINFITDPEGLPTTFKAVPLYGVKHGKLVLASDGAFTYTPMQNFKGQDSFFVDASDGVGTSRHEVLFAVGINMDQVIPTPPVSVGPPTVDQRYYTVSFPVTTSPAMKECDVWRLTVLQGALDCACQCYTRTDCFDIKMAKC